MRRAPTYIMNVLRWPQRVAAALTRTESRSAWRAHIQEELATLNDHLTFAERKFLNPTGLPMRPWFKNRTWTRGLTKLSMVHEPHRILSSLLSLGVICSRVCPGLPHRLRGQRVPGPLGRHPKAKLDAGATAGGRLGGRHHKRSGVPQRTRTADAGTLNHRMQCSRRHICLCGFFSVDSWPLQAVVACVYFQATMTRCDRIRRCMRVRAHGCLSILCDSAICCNEIPLCHDSAAFPPSCDYPSASFRRSATHLPVSLRKFQPNSPSSAVPPLVSQSQ